MGLFDLFKKKPSETAKSAKTSAPSFSIKKSEEAAPEPEHGSYIRRVKVVGVTFKNDDGTSRQKILKDLHKRKPPFDTTLNIELEEYIYEGKPAYHVNVNGKTIGNVGQDMAYFIKQNESRILCISDFKVYESFRDPETEELIPYSATMKIRVQSKSKSK